MELEIEDVDAESAMKGAIEGLQDRLAENKVELQIVAPEKIGAFRGDSKRVRQILFNLLSNAIGFSRPGQVVSLAALRRDGDVVFKVVDRGRGIPPEILERVFDRFEFEYGGVASSRRRSWAVHRQGLHGTARRQNSNRLDAGRRHSRNLHFSWARGEGRAACDRQLRSNQTP